MSLKSFQSEIQEIYARELARQRGQASVTPAPRNIHTRKIQIPEESNIIGEPPPSRDTGVEDEVEAVLVLHLSLPCCASTQFFSGITICP
jgi:hypothetical protein